MEPPSAPSGRRHRRPPCLRAARRRLAASCLPWSIRLDIATSQTSWRGPDQTWDSPSLALRPHESGQGGRGAARPPRGEAAWGIRGRRRGLRPTREGMAWAGNSGPDMARVTAAPQLVADRAGVVVFALRHRLCAAECLAAAEGLPHTKRPEPSIGSRAMALGLRRRSGPPRAPAGGRTASLGLTFHESRQFGDSGLLVNTRQTPPGAAR
jgi:hypothetical protein